MVDIEKNQELALVGLTRKLQRNWSSQVLGQQISREDAVKVVAAIFLDQLQEQVSLEGIGGDFALSVMCFGKFFPNNPPTESELARVLEEAKTDYYAHLAVTLLVMLNRENPPRQLKTWEQELYLGLIAAPPKPRGPSLYQNAHRDMLIVGQIKQLQAVGWLPTRNEAVNTQNSGCDVVREALAIAGVHLSYGAIESVWKKRGSIDTRIMGELFYGP